MPKERRPEEEGTTWGAARVLDVLEFLGRRTSPAPASIIASSCHIPRSSTYGLLNLLKDRRFVTYRADERAWSLGSAAFELSADAPLFAHGLAVLRAFATSSRGLTVQQIATGAGMSRVAVTRILPLPRGERPAARRPGRHLLARPRAGQPGLARRLGRPAAHRGARAPRAAARRDQRDGQPHRARRRPRHLRRPGRELLRAAAQRLGGSPRAAGGHGDRRRLRRPHHVARRQGRGRDRRDLHRLRHRPPRRRRRRRHHGAELAHRGVRRRARAAHGRGRRARDRPAPAR